MIVEFKQAAHKTPESLAVGPGERWEPPQCTAVCSPHSAGDRLCLSPSV